MKYNVCVLLAHCAGLGPSQDFWHFVDQSSSCFGAARNWANGSDGVTRHRLWCLLVQSGVLRCFKQPLDVPFLVPRAVYFMPLASLDCYCWYGYTGTNATVAVSVFAGWAGWKVETETPTTYQNGLGSCLLECVCLRKKAWCVKYSAKDMSDVAIVQEKLRSFFNQCAKVREVRGDSYCFQLSTDYCSWRDPITDCHSAWCLQWDRQPSTILEATSLHSVLHGQPYFSDHRSQHE